MGICYKDIFELAHNIVQQWDNEAALRSGGSRAYYSTYHCALGLNKVTTIFHFDDAGEHETLLRSFDMSKNKKVRQVAKRLRMLKFLRVDADYHLDLDFTRDTYDEAIATARALIKQIEHILESEAAKAS